MGLDEDAPSTNPLTAAVVSPPGSFAARHRVPTMLARNSKTIAMRRHFPLLECNLKAS
jgi:hypothetical protein